MPGWDLFTELQLWQGAGRWWSQEKQPCCSLSAGPGASRHVRFQVFDPEGCGCHIYFPHTVPKITVYSELTLSPEEKWLGKMWIQLSGVSNTVMHSWCPTRRRSGKRGSVILYLQPSSAEELRKTYHEVVLLPSLWSFSGTIYGLYMGQKLCCQFYPTSIFSDGGWESNWQNNGPSPEVLTPKAVTSGMFFLLRGAMQAPLRWVSARVLT